jgi:hypothetical protein
MKSDLRIVVDVKELSQVQHRSAFRLGASSPRMAGFYGSSLGQPHAPCDEGASSQARRTGVGGQP